MIDRGADRGPGIVQGRGLGAGRTQRGTDWWRAGLSHWGVGRVWTEGGQDSGTGGGGSELHSVGLLRDSRHTVVANSDVLLGQVWTSSVGAVNSTGTQWVPSAGVPLQPSARFGPLAFSLL